MQSIFRSAPLAFIFLALPLLVLGQAARKPVSKKATQKAVETAPTPAPTPAPSPSRENIKKNEGKANARPAKAATAEIKNYVPTYFYTFERPGFNYGKINIEHDESGRGRISMKRDGYDEMFTDPIQLSVGTMDQLRTAFADLKFLDSAEDYQYPGRDYSHLGNVTITHRANGKERTTKFNWTENKSAKALMDEYRRIANEFTWRLEFVSARENQPLLTPGLIETLDGYIQRNEISDPPHLIPFLQELAADERIPLMGRNRLGRMIDRIKKAATKH